MTVNRRLDFGDDLDHDLDADILTAFLPLRTSANSKNNLWDQMHWRIFNCSLRVLGVLV